MPPSLPTAAAPPRGPVGRPPFTGTLVAALALLFFFSGACALVYQTLWLRVLSLTFGVTVYAASTVLASFMTGLAVGSTAAGRVADRSANPIRLFGLVEVLVGVFALASPVALDLSRQVYVALHPRLADSLPLLTAVRFGLSFLVLIVPTALMGATLPLVLKSALSRSSGLGARASQLYAVNTLGAIGGALTAGFLLVPFVGVQRSFLLAAGVNAAIGLAALWLSRRHESATSDRAEEVGSIREPSADTGADMPGDALSGLARTLVLAVFGLSGITSLALEVVWFRVLVVFLRPTTYAFTIMLAAVLAGIAIGSALVAPFMKRRLDWLLVLASVELALALVMLTSFAGLGPGLTLAADLPARLEGWPVLAYLAPLVVASLLAIFPTALLLGAAFPIGLRLFAASVPPVRAASAVGLFYATNVSGAILGSVGAGFLLIPTLGSRLTVQVLAGVTLVAGLLLCAAAARRPWLRPAGLALAAIAGFAALATTMPDPFVFAQQRLTRQERVLWREEGVQTTVAVHERGRQRIMYLDGHHQANDSAGTSFVHQRIGWLPTVLHPTPKQALVVGLGGGATPGAIARFPGVQVDVIELSPSVIRGAAWFDRINFGLLQRPNARMVVDDGRNYLMLRGGGYDVITADAILPHHAGSGNLYSREHYLLVRRALAPDGLVLQWIGAGGDTGYRMMVRTFLDVFPLATLWGDGSLLVASKRPLRISRSAFESRLADPQSGPVLRALGLTSFDRLTGQFVAGPEALAAFVGEGSRLSDDQPRLEYFLSLPTNDPPVDLSGVKGDVWRHVVE